MSRLVPTLLAVVALSGCATPEPEPAPVQPEADEIQARLVDAPWGDDAPGEAVMPQKFLPINRVPYATPAAMRNEVADDDLVIGIAWGESARAYPIKMLGGPHREIVNGRLADVPYAVNW